MLVARPKPDRRPKPRFAEASIWKCRIPIDRETGMNMHLSQMASVPQALEGCLSIVACTRACSRCERLFNDSAIPLSGNFRVDSA